MLTVKLFWHWSTHGKSRQEPLRTKNESVDTVDSDWVNDSRRKWSEVLVLNILICGLRFSSHLPTRICLMMLSCGQKLDTNFKSLSFERQCCCCLRKWKCRLLYMLHYGCLYYLCLKLLITKHIQWIAQA
jgi:hypothetical protein